MAHAGAIDFSVVAFIAGLAAAAILTFVTTVRIIRTPELAFLDRSLNATILMSVAVLAAACIVFFWAWLTP